MGEAKPIYPRRALIERTVAAARAAGIKVGGIEISPDGTIRILSEGEGKADSSFERWKAKRERAA